MLKKVLFLCSAVMLSTFAGQAKAAIIQWDVDSSQSFVRLNLPLNTTTNVSGVNLNLRLRNANNATWSDAGGRASNFGGTLLTRYKETGVTGAVGNSVKFLQGQQSMTSINFGSFRPNPAAFDPNATNADNPDGSFTNTSGAPASFAVRINVNALIFVNATVGFLALRDVEYDAAGTIALNDAGGGNFSGTGGAFGIQGGRYSLDANDIGLGIGQLLPDVGDDDLADLLGGSILQANTGALTITNLGGRLRRLDQVINIPFDIPIDEFVLSGSIVGNLVAFATVPEPASLSLLGLGVAGMAFRRRREV